MKPALWRTAGMCVVAAVCVPRAARATTCSITQVVAVAFGTYDPMSPTPNDAAGSVSVLCTGTVLPTVVLTLNTGVSNSFGQRTMTGPSTPMNYNLYTDANRTFIWGDGLLDGTVSWTIIGLVLGFTSTVPIYGRIPAQQTVIPGMYSDSITITANF
jgi:spore coat protein U-like protein